MPSRNGKIIFQHCTFCVSTESRWETLPGRVSRRIQGLGWVPKYLGAKSQSFVALADPISHSLRFLFISSCAFENAISSYTKLYLSSQLLGLAQKMICLVVSTYPSEKCEFVSWGYEIPNIWKVIIHSCSKPPTSDSFLYIPRGEWWGTYFIHTVDGDGRNPANHQTDGWNPINHGLFLSPINWWFGFRNHPQYS